MFIIISIVVFITLFIIMNCPKNRRIPKYVINTKFYKKLKNKKKFDKHFSKFENSALFGIHLFEIVSIFALTFFVGVGAWFVDFAIVDNVKQGYEYVLEEFKHEKNIKNEYQLEDLLKEFKLDVEVDSGIEDYMEYENSKSSDKKFKKILKSFGL